MLWPGALEGMRLPFCLCKSKCARTRGGLAAGSPVLAFFYADLSVPDLADDWLPGDPMTN